MIFNKDSGSNSSRDSKYFDVHYGIASAAITNGTVVVATTAADYHGIAILATSAGATIRIYDSTATTAGNLLDILMVTADVSTRADKVIPVKARLGIVANIVNGTGANGAVYYSPKG